MSRGPSVTNSHVSKTGCGGGGSPANGRERRRLEARRHMGPTEGGVGVANGRTTGTAAGAFPLRANSPAQLLLSSPRRRQELAQASVINLAAQGNRAHGDRKFIISLGAKTSNSISWDAHIRGSPHSRRGLGTENPGAAGGHYWQRRTCSEASTKAESRQRPHKLKPVLAVVLMFHFQ